MRQARTQEFFCFALYVVFDSANGDALSVNHHIRCASISVIGLANAACIRYFHPRKSAHIRTMNMSVDRDLRAKRRVSVQQFVVAGIWHRSSPQVVGAGMNQAKAFLGVQMRKSFKPSQAFFTDACERRWNHLLQYCEKWRELRRCGRKFSQTFGGPKHLVCISADSGPCERANLIDNLSRVRSSVSQIAAMYHEVGCDLSQVGENCLEGAPIAVNIRYDGDSHLVRRPCDGSLDAARYDISQAIFS